MVREVKGKKWSEERRMLWIARRIECFQKKFILTVLIPWQRESVRKFNLFHWIWQTCWPLVVPLKLVSVKGVGVVAVLQRLEEWMDSGPWMAQYRLLLQGAHWEWKGEWDMRCTPLHLWSFFEPSIPSHQASGCCHVLCACPYYCPWPDYKCLYLFASSSRLLAPWEQQPLLFTLCSPSNSTVHGTQKILNQYL